MIPLVSSNLSGYEYDEASQVLSIRFSSGRTYRYGSVPQTVADGLGTADSPGRYFNSKIKNSFSET